MPLNASIIVPSWCLFAWVAAGAMYRAVLWSFDSRLGRMEETSQEGWGAKPTRLVPVGEACDDEDW